MNTALYETVDGEPVFVGFCYTHQGRRVLIDGEDGCQHEKCLAFRDMTFEPRAMFNITRLKNQNALGQTENEIEREVIDTAARDGRDIQRPTH